MLKQSITFEDLNGEEVTEDHFFHISKAEMVEMEMSFEGGLSEHLQKIVETGNPNAIIQTFKKIILDAYGTKSDDGKRFIKTPEMRAEFANSEAYSTFFMQLVTDAGKAAEFVNGIVPKGLQQDADKIKDGLPPVLKAPRGVRGEDNAEGAIVQDPGPDVARPADGGPGVPRVLTKAEIVEMDQNTLQDLLSTGQAVIGDS